MIPLLRAPCVRPRASGKHPLRADRRTGRTVPALAALPPETRRFLLFCLVGGSGVFVNLAIFYVFRHFILSPGTLGDNVAVFAGWVGSVASNFALNHWFTFRDTTRGSAVSVWHRLGRYYVSTLVAFGLQWCVFQASRACIVAIDLPPEAIFGVWALVLRWEAGLSNLAGIGVATIANYVLSKRIVFKP